MSDQSSVSIADTVEQHLQLIEKLNPKLNAVLTLTAEEARARAAALDKSAANGNHLSALHGLPMIIKDCLAVKGIRSTWGNKAYENRIADHDAELVMRLKNAGAVFLGMSNLSELCFSVTNLNDHFGAARNPWNTDHVTGGSSGGSAASVAAGLCRVAIGTDTGGSVRIPASFCGVTGLRPTVGRIPTTGGLSLSTRFDTAGPIAYDIADVAAVYMVIAGYDPADPNSVERPVENVVAAVKGNIEGMAIGIPKSFYYDNLDTDVAARLQDAIKTFESCGASIVDIDLADAAGATKAAMGIVAAETLEAFADQIAEKPETISRSVLANMKFGERVSGVRFAAARRRLQEWDLTLRKAFDDVDFILTPSVPCTAIPISPDADSHENLQKLTTGAYAIGAAGVPSMSVPCGFDGKGLPVGMQITAPWWHEATLFRAGGAFQVRTDFHTARPKF